MDCVAQNECSTNQLKPISSPANPADSEVSQGRVCAIFTPKTPRPWPDIKVDFDGACFQDQNLAGAVAVIRDKNGQVLATMADKIS